VYLPPPEHRDLVANAAAIVVQAEDDAGRLDPLSGTMLVREMP
jgi:hypothetical protein